MRVMGLDLSLTGSGVVVIERTGQVLFSRTITSRLTDMERLAFIRGEIGEVLSKYSPMLTCIEGYSMGSRSGQLASIGELGGVIKLLLHRNKFRYTIVAPTQLKKFVTGKGSAMKDEIMMHVYKRWGYEAKDNNTADAYGLSRIALALEGEDNKLIAPQKEVIRALVTPLRRKSKQEASQ